MEITGPNLPANLLKGVETARTPLNFTVGQILQALSKGNTEAGLLKLQIGVHEVLAQSKAPVEAGRQLTLRVESAGRLPELRVLNPLSPASVKADALKQILPRMMALAPALTKVLNVPKAADATPLPPTTRTLIQEIAQQIPAAQMALSPQGLKAAVALSGLFPEAQLLQNQKPVPDLKTALQRVAAQLRSQPTGTATPETNPARHATAGPPAGNPAMGKQAPATPPQTAMSSPQAKPTAQAPTAVANPAAAAAPAKPNSPPPLPVANPAHANSAQTNPKAPAKADAAAPQNPATGNTKAADGKNPVPVRTGDVRVAVPVEGKTTLTATTTPQSAPPAQANPAQSNTAPAKPSTAPGAPAPQAQTASRPPAAAADFVLKVRLMAEPEAARKAQPQPLENASTRLVQELTRQVEGALSRIQYNQLQSLPQEDPNRQAWQLDLALRNGEQLDAFQLKVEEDRRGKKPGQDGSTWTINLSFDLAPLGPIHTRVGLNADTVSSTFWAEKPETALLISAKLETLKQGFERAGLDVGKLDCHRGKPATDEEHRKTPSILDENA